MGLFGLFGGYGEFDPWSETVHRRLVDEGEGDGSVRILPMGLDEETVVSTDLPLYRALGIPADVLAVTSREEAERADNAEALSTASLIFLHGGMPAWVCGVLRGTPVWQQFLALSRAVRR